jgi:membrane protein DedA with SNARE-associated domain
MLEAITGSVTGMIAASGYGALIFLMGLESANIPIPSEIIMPFGGFLAAQGRLNIHVVALAGGLGCLWGSLLSYWLGYRFGRPLIEKYGRWLMISPKQVVLGDRLFEKYGSAVSFYSRLLPVVRTFISFVAGIWKVKLWPFAVLTFVGSWIWSYILAYVGFKLGENWETLRPLWHKFDIFIVSSGVLTVAVYVWHHVRESRRPPIAELAAVPSIADEDRPTTPEA